MNLLFIHAFFDDQEKNYNYEIKINWKGNKKVYNQSEN